MIVDPCFLFPGVQSALIDVGRKMIAKRATQKDLQRALKPDHPWQFDDQHTAGRARQEVAMRNGALRGLPSCFGDVGPGVAP